MHLSMKVAFLDHNDSFTNNVIALLEDCLPESANIRVFLPNEKINTIKTFDPNLIVIGPGPGRPNHYPLLQDVLSTFSALPTLGICLGMQAMNEYQGGRTIKSLKPMHGKISIITHDGSSIFKEMPKNFRGMRYHSLQIELADSVRVLAEVDKIPMVIQVDTRPQYGIQFHPESFASEYGHTLIKNILEACDAN